MSTKQTSFGLLLFVLLVGLGAVPVPAATPDIEAASQTCPQFPEVDYWINDPAKIVRTISRSYRGSWERYIDRWKAYQEKMVRISEAEGFAIIKSRAIRLEGDLYQFPKSLTR